MAKRYHKNRCIQKIWYEVNFHTASCESLTENFQYAVAQARMQETIQRNNAAELQLQIELFPDDRTAHYARAICRLIEGEYENDLGRFLGIKDKM